MKTFRDLTITGNPKVLQDVMTTLEGFLVDGWQRDRLSEAHLIGATNDSYCFTCTAQAERRAAALWLFVDTTHLHVGNIVPMDDRRLAYDEYNNILEDFFHQVVLPATADRDVHAQLSADEVKIETWLTDGAASLLRAFSRAANKSTGSAHPADRERWEAFLIAAHKERSALSPSILERWLTEEERWPANTARDLAVEYESARSLVASYDRDR